MRLSDDSATDGSGCAPIDDSAIVDAGTAPTDDVAAPCVGSPLSVDVPTDANGTDDSGSTVDGLIRTSVCVSINGGAPSPSFLSARNVRLTTSLSTT